ncbi:MAG TPA: YraN family protein [Devosiaceae bacterium]|jgi:putative endonuclease|nr:YraN family protein [Devosiaceae bacterium]
MPPSPSRRASEARLRAERQGRRGEALAALWLGLQFYGILERRFKTPVGEIDLIAARFGTTVFVEVKSRGRGESEAEALAKVDRRRLVRAAEYYLARHPELAAAPLRFDVIFLAPKSLPRHLRNAFTS